MKHYFSEALVQQEGSRIYGSDVTKSWFSNTSLHHSKTMVLIPLL